MINQDSTNLSINGKGEIAIKNTQSSVNITSNSQINGPFQITVSNNVNTITLDSIEFEKSSSLLVQKENDNEKVNLNVKTISVSPNTQASITNMKILESLKITETSTMNFDNVSFDNDQTVVSFVINFQKENKGQNVFLKGIFNDPPKSLVLNKVSLGNSGPDKNLDYILIEGRFNEEKCSEWLSKINYGNSGFDWKSCENNDNLLAYQNQKIVIKANQSDNKKLSGGQIAGIVIGCIAGVAIIVVVIVIIIKKKNKGTESESQNQEDDANEL